MFINKRPLAGLLSVAILAGALAPAQAQTPQPGGTLKLAVRGEPTSYDCQTASSIATLQYLAPHYSTLMRFDQDDYPTVVGDVAESWTISDDLMTYDVTLKPGITFHDGTALEAADVKATFERIAFPPEGAVSVRETAFSDLDSIEVVDPLNVSFKLKSPSSGFLSVLASPWNCLYSAELLAENPDYPGRVVMGSGPFTFTEFVAGSHWTGTKYADYFKEGQPYLDDFRLQMVEGPAALNSIASGELNGNFRLISVPDRERMTDARGDEIKFQVTPTTSVTLLTINTTRPPFDDVRVRRALSLAIDRPTGVRVLGDIAGQRWSHIVFREGHADAPSESEKTEYAGFGADIEANREEARRLLEEAGQSDLTFTLLNRNLPVPYEPLAVFFIDQWRQIGATVTQEPMDTAGWAGHLSSLDYDVAIDLNAPASDDPSEVLLKYLPGASNNYTGIEDEKLIELYEAQNKTGDPAERSALVKQFVDRVVELQYVIPTYNAERIVVMDANLMGWQVPPSFAVGLDLGGIWFDN